MYSARKVRFKSVHAVLGMTLSAGDCAKFMYGVRSRRHRLVSRYTQRVTLGLRIDHGRQCDV